MANEPIISVSGLRGIVGESLSPDLAVRYVAAFAASVSPGPIVLASDGRTTAPMLLDAARSSIVASGRTCLDFNIASTPTVGILVRQFRAAGGVQISASHNPPEYNGIKLFGNDGRVVNAAVGKAVEARYRRGETAFVPFDRVGSTRRPAHPDEAIEAHLRLVLTTVDVDRIRSRRFRVLLDANHGSGSLLGAALLEALGCQVELLGGTADGRFAHPAEPTEENLATVPPRIRAAKADVGFCQDPDADRLAILDQRGRYLGEESTLALCVDHVLRRRKGPIVINLSTSRMSEDLANRHGVPLFRAAVGEANVVDRMLACNAVLGGEGNGGVIDPRVGLVRDSFAGMALVLDAMAARDKTIAELADELPRYAMLKTKYQVEPTRMDGAFANIATHFAAADECDRTDGLRFGWSDRWLHVRKSNTEPIVRAIAEAPTHAAAQQLCDEAARCLA